MNKPLVTIGMTCFNAEDTIERAVNSALNQSWENTEIVVVDDFSTDRSVSILKSLASEQPGIRLVSHSVNRGYPAALNTIIENAQGAFIAIFDDDDESIPDRLCKQIDRIVEYEKRNDAKLILCYSNRNVVPGGGTKPCHVAKALGRRPKEPRGVAVAEAILNYWCDPCYVWGMFGSCTLMARTKLFEAIGPFDEMFRRSAEWDYAVRAALRGAHFIAVDEPLITQFKTRGSCMEKDMDIKYHLLLVKKYKKFLRKRNFYLASRMIAREKSKGHGRSLRSNVYWMVALLLSPSRFFQVLCKRLRLPRRGSVS